MKALDCSGKWHSFEEREEFPGSQLNNLIQLKTLSKKRQVIL